MLNLSNFKDQAGVFDHEHQWCMHLEDNKDQIPNVLQRQNRKGCRSFRVHRPCPSSITGDNVYHTHPNLPSKPILIRHPPTLPIKGLTTTHLKCCILSLTEQAFEQDDAEEFVIIALHCTLVLPRREFLTMVVVQNAFDVSAPDCMLWCIIYKR